MKKQDRTPVIKLIAPIAEKRQRAKMNVILALCHALMLIEANAFVKKTASLFEKQE